MTSKIKDKVSKLKRDLNALLKELKHEVLLMEIALENNKIPEGISKAQYKKQLSKYRSIVNRNTIDRIFLESMDIIHTIKHKKTKNKKTNSKLNNVARLVSKVKTITDLSQQDKDIIRELMKDIDDKIAE